MPSALHERTVMPPDDLSSLSRFANGLAGPSVPGRARLIGPDGSELDLPEELYGLLRDVVTALSQGVAISIAPRHTMLTTQEAADLLNISRPTLVRLLTQGEIPHTMRGRHRRVLLRDVLDYQNQTREERRRALDDMVAEAEDLDLYTAARPPEDLR
ncbi:helix-turn-helix domain-containing protein [Pseudosporangium ferrugineum]|uniref:Excisionase family DNA binding protein n=1 Tax=Pseudosporangium ferrugineum TaxID=439699 RepID=A0A2T0S7H2_9ACTN|nr:helix-turn-helix domain-containing protein [Pseudosporangium ferrugineum]PRY29364.1 excisionase family DNA binding protein [Pseudosporangium ferrugineum]